MEKNKTICWRLFNKHEQDQSSPAHLAIQISARFQGQGQGQALCVVAPEEKHIQVRDLIQAVKTRMKNDRLAT